MYQATLRTGARRVLMALLIAAALACALIALPSSAQALEVTATTARSNSDNDNSIYGGMETRVTWEAQTASDESLSTLTLDYPDGSTIPANQVKVTGLSGLNRITLDYTVASVDADTVTISFNTPTQAGLLIRVEASKAVLPAEGGSLSVSGSATLANGTQVDIPNGPAMNVVGVSVAQQLSNKLSEQGWVQAWNQNRLLHMFFDPTIIVISIPAVFHGWLLALLMVVCSFPIAIVIGLLLCFLRISHVGILRFLGSLYVNIVRGTPLFLQIYIAFFGLPLLGINIDNYLLSVIVMSLNSGAYLCEIFRAGIESISKGQFEAARSLGMNAVQTMFFVIIPQAFRRVIPTMTSEFILLYKDTSLFAAVGVMEMVMFARSITATTGNMTPYIVAALFYLLVTLPLTKFINIFEKRLADPSHGHKRDGSAPSPARLTDEETTLLESAPKVDSEHVTATSSLPGTQA